MSGLASSRQFWNEKAIENPFWYISSYGSYDNRNEAEFWASGVKIWEQLKAAVEYRPQLSDTVVEIGCGIGRLTRAITQDVHVCHSFDISQEMLAKARINAPGAVFHLTVGDSLKPLPDACSDLTLAYCVLQHLPSLAVLKNTLDEMVRVTKHGGTVAFTTAPRDWSARLMPALRLKTAILAPFRAGGPKGTYKKEWVGIRPSRSQIGKLCSIKLNFLDLSAERWLFWGITGS